LEEVVDLLQGELDRGDLGRPAITIEAGSLKVTSLVSTVVAGYLLLILEYTKGAWTSIASHQREAKVLQNWKSRSNATQFYSVAFDGKILRYSRSTRKQSLSTDRKISGPRRRSISVEGWSILAEADIEECAVILGEDVRTLTRRAEFLLKVGETSVRSMLLRDGFVPFELSNSDQKGLDLGQ
jgi:hypothetical protein